MKTAAGIVTERGGRTSHAAIVARELGIPARRRDDGPRRRSLGDGASITISCAEGETGRVYEGDGPVRRAGDRSARDARGHARRSCSTSATPSRRSSSALLPSDGVGLARMEFIFASWVGVHPLALTRYATLPAGRAARGRPRDRAATPTRRATSSTASRKASATIAAAFHPRPVILRFSDFKTNEYATLARRRVVRAERGEPDARLARREPLLPPGLQGGLPARGRRRASACARSSGSTNLKLMIPFCRTPEEGERVLDDDARRRARARRATGSRST